MGLLLGTHRALLGGAAAAFVPTDLAGLILWLKADAGTFQDAALTTPATADEHPVGGWVDQSGNGNNVLQVGAAGTRPTLKLNIQNGLPVLRCDGNDYLRKALGAALSQPFHVFGVVKLGAGLDVDASFYYWISSDDSTNRLICAKSGDTPKTWRLMAGTNLNIGTPDTNWDIWSAYFNGASSSLRINGSTIGAGNAGAHNADGITVGTSWVPNNYWNGDIGEILIYDPSLSDANRALVEAYLSSRWSIALP